jgi:Na+/H+ antiporter NhaC
VPVRRIVITALNTDGTLDSSFQGRPLIEGIRYTVPEGGERFDRETGQRIDQTSAIHLREDAELPPFHNGVLELTTDYTQGRKVYITQSLIVVAAGTRSETVFEVYRTLRWFCLVPMALAMLLAVWLRSALVALLAGVWSAAVIYLQGNFFAGFARTLDTFLIAELVEPGRPGLLHLLIVMFTIFWGATIGVVARSGGSAALVRRLARFTATREHAQLLTTFLGFVVFFDRYANTLLVGGALRPVTDKVHVSREKLALLVNSTSAAVAGLAVVSTWVGIELATIADAYVRLGLSHEVYGTFLATIPYRFYPLHLLVFVLLVAYLGHDFGPMLAAEARELPKGEEHVDSAPPSDVDEPPSEPLRHALIPWAVLLASVVVGLWWTGSAGLASHNAALVDAGQPAEATTFYGLLAHARPAQVLVFATFLASLAGLASVVVSRTLTFEQAMEAWLEGARGMFLPVLILVLAWSMATLCDPEHLNTAGLLVELTHGLLDVQWMPALAFLLAAAVAFASGSALATWGLIMPLVISLTYYLLLDRNEVDANHHLMLGAIGAVLSGAIFGSHCSPITDTTVLSSAAAGCDHLRHFFTQLPYAGAVAAVSLLLGYIPVGFGYSPIVLLPLGLIVLFLLVQFVGRSASEPVRASASTDDEAGGPNLDEADLASLLPH